MNGYPSYLRYPIVE